MSNSGPLLPTVTQGVQGERSPHEPLSPLACFEAGSFNPLPSIPLSEGGAVASLQLSPSKNTGQRRDVGCLQIDLASPSSEQRGVQKQLGSPRAPPSGKERCSLREIDAEFSEMFQDEGGGDGPAYVESDDEGAFRGGTPPTPMNLRAARWGDSLQNLLSDEIGATRFRSYLERESSSGPSPKTKLVESLSFLFACRGLKGERKKISESVMVIWKFFLFNKTVKISRETFNAIEHRINTNDFCDSHIFDQAQKEVEDTMSNTSYRAFLKSEMYLSYLQPTTDKREGAESPQSPCSFPDAGFCSFAPCNNFLPTLHEDTEFCSRERAPPYARLTSDNLLASLNYRANLDRIKPEAKAGLYLKENIQLKHYPYHLMYGGGPVSSLQDSELQSFSSGANTDDTSITDSSVDLSFSRSQLKRQNKWMKENALRNKEPQFVSSNSGVHVIPRTMLVNRSNCPDSQTPRAETNPEEFARLLTEKLNLRLEEQQSKENVLHSLRKISEDSSEEARREHAVNTLPPNVLLGKLNEKFCLLDDQDPSQSILDEHVARIWDSPICSPSSPKAATGGGSPPGKGGSKIATKQLPHLEYPYPNSNSSHVTQKCSSKNGRYHSSYSAAPSGSSSMYPSAPQPVMGARKRHPQFQSVEAYAGHAPHAYQPRTYHVRRRERGPDVYSTFSSDSGNVADYHDVCERIAPSSCAPPSHLPKSKSMPEYIENHAGTTSDGASSGRRHQMSSGVRRSRRTPADCTDSGVSVVSDSGRSAAPSTSSDRVESWLNQSKSFNRGAIPSYSVCPGWDREGSTKEFHKARGPKSMHTVAGSTSPGTQRKGCGSSGRRSQCSSSTSATTCINIRSDSSPMTSAQPGLSRDSPLGQAQPCDTGERRKSKGSSSSKSTGPSSSSVGEGSGSNGSTMKKQHKSSKQSGGEFVPAFQSPAQGGSHYSFPQAFPEVTTVVYSFQDDLVPFIIKIPSRPVTLKKLKQHLHKKGDYRYFFKKFCEGVGMVNEEITEDSECLPLFEGKVFAQIHHRPNTPDA